MSTTEGNKVNCVKCGKEVHAAYTNYCGTEGRVCWECSPKLNTSTSDIKKAKHVIACRSCGGQPKRKRTKRIQTLYYTVDGYYWYECACGLQEGKEKYFTKRSHARAYWNAQNSLVHAINRLCDLLQNKST